jgi:hypothetical protein
MWCAGSCEDPGWAARGTVGGEEEPLRLATLLHQMESLPKGSRAATHAKWSNKQAFLLAASTAAQRRVAYSCRQGCDLLSSKVRYFTLGLNITERGFSSLRFTNPGFAVEFLRAGVEFLRAGGGTAINILAAGFVGFCLLLGVVPLVAVIFHGQTANGSIIAYMPVAILFIFGLFFIYPRASENSAVACASTQHTANAVHNVATRAQLAIELWRMMAARNYE